MRAPILIGAALLPLALVGCGGSPATRFLTLQPAPPAIPPAAYAGPPVRVPFLRVPVTLDRPEFAREAGETVVVADFDRWAAPLGLLARNTLIQNLQARLPTGLLLPPDAGPASPEVRVEVTVLAFRIEGGEAVMSASYTLVRPNAAGASRPMTLRASVGEATPQAQARAWSALVGQLADRIAQDLAAGR